MPRAGVHAAVLLAVALAGCTGAPPAGSPGGPAAAPPPADDGPLVAKAIADCELCVEPNSAWTRDGGLVVTMVSGELAARSTDGGRTFTEAAGPPMPEGGTGRGDALVHADEAGRLWWSAMVFGRDGPEVGAPRVQVARSDDGGHTWPVDTTLSMGAPGDPTQATSAIDRQWLVTGPGGFVFVVCNCPVAAGTQAWASTDDGQTWAVGAVPTPARPGPPGRPALGLDGFLVVPFLAGVTPAPTEFVAGRFPVRAAGVAAAVSPDRGGSWEVRPVDLGPDSATICCAMPVAAATPDGAVHIAWHRADGRAVVASSADGGATWSAPEPLAPDVAGGIYPHVWIEPLPAGGVVAAWFTGAREEAEVHAAWGEPGRGFQHRALASGRAITDHPHAAVRADGRVAVTFVDPEGHAAVALFTPGAPQAAR